MKMNKLISIVMAALLVCSMVVTGCGSRGGNRGNGGADEVEFNGTIDPDSIPEMTITFAHLDATDPNMQSHGIAVYLQEKLAEFSGGKIKMDIVGGGALGNATELLEQVVAGQIEMTNAITDANLAIIWKDMNVLSVPFAFRSVDQMMDVWDSSFGDELEASILEKTGARVAFVCQNGGMRNFTNNVKPIATPADMKNMKIRVMDSPAHMAMITALGANPTSIAWTELYTALQTNVVDGQENAVPAIVQANLYEVQKYMSTDGHLASFLFTVVNNDWYNNLNGHAKAAVDQAFAETEAYARTFVAEIADKGMKTLEENGMEIHETTAEELKQFQDATVSVKELIKNTLLDDPTIMDRFDTAIKESDARLGF